MGIYDDPAKRQGQWAMQRTGPTRSAASGRGEIAKTRVTPEQARDMAWPPAHQDARRGTADRPEHPCEYEAALPRDISSHKTCCRWIRRAPDPATGNAISDHQRESSWSGRPAPGRSRGLRSRRAVAHTTVTRWDETTLAATRSRPRRLRPPGRVEARIETAPADGVDAMDRPKPSPASASRGRTYRSASPASRGSARARSRLAAAALPAARPRSEKTVRATAGSGSSWSDSPSRSRRGDRVAYIRR